jgi:nucleoside-diphosphate-sugar epimerase
LKSKARAFNLGTGTLTTGEDLAAAVRKACPGVRVEVEEQPARQRGPAGEQPLDMARSRQELGYAPKFDLAQGIADFVRELQAAK